MYFIYVIIKKEKGKKSFRSRESNPEIKASKDQLSVVLLRIVNYISQCILFI
jgi:hypothetical protein